MATWLDPAAEAALVQRLRDRNQEAAADLVHGCLPELFGTARESGLQDQDAYAVACEALERAVRAIDSFQPRPGANLRSWIFRILVNCIRTWARKEKRLRAHEVGGVEFAEGSVDPDAGAVDCDPPPVRKAIPAPIAEDGVPAASPLAGVTTALLDCMSPRERDVMIRTAAGWSDNEIAADLGIKPGAVRVARRRARSRAVAGLKDIAPTLDETIQRRLRKLLH